VGASRSRYSVAHLFLSSRSFLPDGLLNRQSRSGTSFLLISRVSSSPNVLLFPLDLCLVPFFSSVGLINHTIFPCSLSISRPVSTGSHLSLCIWCIPCYADRILFPKALHKTELQKPTYLILSSTKVFHPSFSLCMPPKKIKDPNEKYSTFMFLFTVVHKSIYSRIFTFLNPSQNIITK